MDSTHHRSPAERRLRLRGFDYRTACLYFVTLKTRRGRLLFGTVTPERVDLSEIGRIVEAFWQRIPLVHHGVRLGDFVVMPNHLHGLVQLPEQPLPPPALRGVARGSLGSILGGFKAAVTRESGWKPGSLWQSRYHDRIVRSERELDRIETYIALNPERWPTDPLNPDRSPAGTISHSA